MIITFLKNFATIHVQPNANRYVDLVDTLISLFPARTTLGQLTSHGCSESCPINQAIPSSSLQAAATRLSF